MNVCPVDTLTFALAALAAGAALRRHVDERSNTNGKLAQISRRQSNRLDTAITATAAITRVTGTGRGVFPVAAFAAGTTNRHIVDITVLA